MKRCLLTIAFAFVSCFFTHQATAQSTLALAPALTHHEQAAVLNGATKTEKAAWMREQVLKSRYGQRGLDNLFKNFEGKGYIDLQFRESRKTSMRCPSAAGSPRRCRKRRERRGRCCMQRKSTKTRAFNLSGLTSQ